MLPLLTLHNAVEQDLAVEQWLGSREGRLGELARHWFAVIRHCGPNVLELMHDGMATACVDNAAFAYVAVYKAHLNIGFFVAPN